MKLKNNQEIITEKIISEDEIKTTPMKIQEYVEQCIEKALFSHLKKVYTELRNKNNPPDEAIKNWVKTIRKKHIDGCLISTPEFITSGVLFWYKNSIMSNEIKIKIVTTLLV